jgi:hypothetical protein
MDAKTKQNADLIDAAVDGLSASLQTDHDSPEWLADVLKAAQRLRATMDLLRHRLDGGHLQ